VKLVRLKHVVRQIFFMISILLLVACEDEEAVTDTGRWYTSAQMQRGNSLFQENCAACHGANAQGLADDWRIRDSNGNLPPPPLNGTAHTWHHSLDLLDQIIAEGGVLYEGNMPGFSDQLSREDRHAVIAYFQGFWTDEIYSAWMEINSR
jgi:mono/diheme cytochrome c family protein